MAGIRIVFLLAVFLGFSWMIRVVVSRGVSRRVEREYSEEV